MTKVLAVLSAVLFVLTMTLASLLITSNSGDVKPAPRPQRPTVNLTVTCPGTEIGGWNTGHPPITNGKG